MYNNTPTNLKNQIRDLRAAIAMAADFDPDGVYELQATLHDVKAQLKAAMVPYKVHHFLVRDGKLVEARRWLRAILTCKRTVRLYNGNTDWALQTVLVDNFGYAVRESSDGYSGLVDIYQHKGGAL